MKTVEIEESFKDEKGRTIREFDVLKIFHFKGVNEQGRGRKNYFMYKWVRLIERDGKKYWTGLHLSDDSDSYFHLRSCAGKDRVLKGAEIVQTG